MLEPILIGKKIHRHSELNPTEITDKNRILNVKPWEKYSATSDGRPRPGWHKTGRDHNIEWAALNLCRNTGP